MNAAAERRAARDAVPPAFGPGSPPVFAGSPRLASIARRKGDGVGYVSLLLDRALRDLFGRDLTAVDLAPARVGRVSAYETARFAGRLGSAALRGRGDWVLYSHLGIARAQRLLPPPLRSPYAVFVHGIEVWESSLDASRISLLRRARLRIANSEYTAHRLAGAHAAVGPVSACALALLPEDGARPRRHGGRPATSPRSPYAVVVGRMSASERYKGHDELLECWPSVRTRCPEARLVVVGDGDDRPRLEAKAATAGLRDSVIFTGRIPDDDLSDVLARATLFAMPSRGEGFGLVYLHAMAAALPCVAATDDAAGEVVADGETGLLVSQGDRDALAAAVAQLLGDPTRARALGDAGRRRFDELFTYEAFRRRLAAVLGVPDATPLAEPR